MIKPQIPLNEEERINSLKSYNVLDTLSEKEYESITKLASQICDTPIALVSLVDNNRQWFKSHLGLDATETPRDLAFCAHAINKPQELLIVPDASKDERFHDNPLSTGGPNVIFYAGAPLNTADGFSLGTLCVIDSKPRELSENQQEALKILADQVIAQLELRKNNRILKENNNEINALNNQLNAFSYRLSHDLKTPLRGITSILNWMREEYNEGFDQQVKEWLSLIDSRTSYMNSLINGMLEYSTITTAKIEFQDFNLEKLITESYKSCVENKKHSITFENCDVNIKQSVISFSMIFQNLITNSIKFNDEDKCVIVIKHNISDNFHHLIYEDNGPGIPEEYRKKIFELFETLGEKNSESTGIGLSTMKSSIERLGGKIEIINKNSKGVCFEIFIPQK